MKRLGNPHPSTIFSINSRNDTKYSTHTHTHTDTHPLPLFIDQYNLSSLGVFLLLSLSNKIRWFHRKINHRLFWVEFHGIRIKLSPISGLSDLTQKWGKVFLIAMLIFPDMWVVSSGGLDVSC